MSFPLEGIQFEEIDTISKPNAPSSQIELDFVPYDEEEKPSKIRSLISAAPKGFIKELRGQLEKSPFLGKKLKEMQKEFPDLVKSDEDVQKLLEEILPTQEGFAERALERGGRIAPYAALGGGSGIAGQAGQAIRSALAGFLGEGAKELGAPSWAQALAELPAFGLPGLGKKISPTSKQKELVEGGRALGLSEEEIAPLIQSEMKQKWLTKLAPKRGRTQEALSKSKKALGNIFSRLEQSEVAKNILPDEQASQVIQSIDKVLETLPKGVRDQISGDFNDLIKNPVSGETLINFWQDLNHYIRKGETKLGILKGPITDAIEKISPQLGSDFRMTNQLYGKYGRMNQLLKPTLVSDLMTAGRAVRTMLGITTGNFPLLIESVGESTAKRLAREMLINPRLQNLSKKMANALNANKISLSTQILNDYVKEIEKTDPEVADLLRDIDFKNLYP